MSDIYITSCFVTTHIQCTREIYDLLHENDEKESENSFLYNLSLPELQRVLPELDAMQDIDDS